MKKMTQQPQRYLTRLELLLRNAVPHLGLHLGAFLLALVAVSLAGCSSQKFGIVTENQEIAQQANYNTEVDVLFVVDNSNSMAPRQDLMASQVGSFVSSLEQTGLDYRIAVTSTDMDTVGHQGAFASQVGSPKVLSKGMANLTSLLAGRIRLGANGSRVEQGLRAMKTALSAPLSSGLNAGFLREKSLLAVVFLSDEDDQSPTEDYKAFLDRLKPKLASGESSWIAQFIGVVPSDTACSSAEWQYFRPGMKYIDLATRSGGVAESICRSDLSDAVTNLRARLLEIITEYKLNAYPQLSTLKVVIDGVEISQSESNGYTYHSDTVSIRFHGTAIPKPFSKIRISFDPEKWL